MPVPPQTLENDIATWSASCSLRGQYTGLVRLVNHRDQYDEDLTGTAFQVNLNATDVVATGGIDATCLSGDSIWINGVITSFEDVIGISIKEVSLSIKSFFARLSRKVVNSERYEEVEVLTVLNDLMNNLGGVPPALFDFSELAAIVPSPKIIAIVAGNNMLEEMKKLVEAAGSELFVQKDGILTAEVWKDDSSPVDVVIPSQAIKGVATQRNLDIVPTRITVRGRFISAYDAGTMTFSGNDSPSSADPGDDSAKRVCYRNGIKATQQILTFKNMRGSDEDRRNMSYVITAPTSGQEVAKVSNSIVRSIGATGRGALSAVSGTSRGALSVAVRNTSGVMDVADRTNNLLMQGLRRPHFEWQSPNTAFVPHRGNRRQEGKRIGWSGWKRIEGGLHLWLDLWGQNDSDKNADEPDDIRIEMVVDDPDLQAEFGVIHAQIDNLYLSDYNQLFEAAIRKFQEFKMQRRSWRVETTYLPCLELNDVVQFDTPEVSDATGFINLAETITGLVAEIKINFDVAPRATMSLIVEEFKDIGTTTYTSGNLFFYPGLSGINGTFTNSWKSAAGTVFMHNGYAGIEGGAFLFQSVFFVGGDTYELTYEVREPASGGSIELVSPNPEPGGPGPHIVILSPSVTGFSNVTFKGTGNGAYLLNPKITRQTIA